MRISNWIKFNELNKSTYYSAADKLDKLNPHNVTSNRLRQHAEEMGIDDNRLNIRYVEIKPFEMIEDGNTFTAYFDGINWEASEDNSDITEIPENMYITIQAHFIRTVKGANLNQMFFFIIAFDNTGVEQKEVVDVVDEDGRDRNIRFSNRADANRFLSLIFKSKYGIYDYNLTNRELFIDCLDHINFPVRMLY
jgi:hypothetical protein